MRSSASAVDARIDAYCHHMPLALDEVIFDGISNKAFSYPVVAVDALEVSAPLSLRSGNGHGISIATSGYHYQEMRMTVIGFLVMLMNLVTSQVQILTLVAVRKWESNLIQEQMNFTLNM